MSISMGTSGTMKDCSAIKIDVGDSARQELNTAMYTDGFIDGYKQGKKDTQQWIPVSERLPEYDGEKYFVTYYAETIGRTRLGISYCYANREGFWSDIPLGYKVIAWMPLPEPYKGEQE